VVGHDGNQFFVVYTDGTKAGLKRTLVGTTTLKTYFDGQARNPLFRSVLNLLIAVVL
jgi:hypothetical protein